MAQQQGIAKLSLECQRNFVEFKAAFDSRNGVKFQNDLPDTAVEDELGRFRIWASNIGALNVGKASLDYRLRGADYLFQNVKSLLEDLKRTLTRGFITLEVVWFLT